MKFVSAARWLGSAGLLFARFGSRRHLRRRQRRKPLDMRWRGAPERQDEFTAAENQQRKRERNDVVEQPEQEHAGEDVFLVELPQRDQHGRIEDADTSRRMARKAEQRGGDEDDGERDEA